MSDHNWCRDTARDEAVRAAEDAAAVPSIQHRDLPEQVALLWASVGDLIGRVVRLEGEMDAGQDEEAAPAVCDSASTAEGLRTERVTLEVTQRVEDYVAPSRWNWCGQLGSHAQPGESVRVVEDATIGTGDVFADVQCGSTADEIARLTAERDAAIRERDAAREEYERLRARADPFGEEMAVIAAWERCAITADWPADEPETAMRCAASMEREIVRLRARVAELEAAAPPRGWLTAEEREAVEMFIRMGEEHDDVDAECRAAMKLRGLLARSTPPRVKMPPWHFHHDEDDAELNQSARDKEWMAAIRAAGGEVE